MRKRGVGAILVFCVVACSGSHGGGGAHPGHRSANFDGFVQLMAETECRIESECGPGFSAFVGGACIDFNLPYYEDTYAPLWRSGLEEGRLEFDPDSLSDCEAAAARLGCSPKSPSELPECQATLRGLVPEAGECFDRFECEAGLTCDLSAGCGGICVRTPREGEACVDYACEAGLGCRGATCARLSALGEACRYPTDVGCADGLYCVGEPSDGHGQGICQAVDASRTARVSEPCDPFVGPRCASPAVCARADFDASTFMGGSWVCVMPYRDGGPCREAVPEGCPAGSYCEASAFAGRVEGTCIRFPTRGQRCDSLADSWFSPAPCAVGLFCDGTCRPRRRVRERCASDDECFSGLCQDARCAVDPCP